MLKARLLTALCLIAGFLTVLFLLPHAWVALVFAGIAVLAAWEWAGLIAARSIERSALLALVSGGCLLLWTQFHPTPTALWIVVSLFWLLAAPLWLWRKWRLAGCRALAILLGTLLILATWAALVALHARNPALLLGLMALVWVADSAAYFSGRAFGRHKLAPAISPGKTWEGVGGAAVGVLTCGVLLAQYFVELQDVATLPLLVALALLTAISVVGDLFESLAKRQAGLKDSGHMLPGHGGVLDRIDSLLPTLPFVALLLVWLE